MAEMVHRLQRLGSGLENVPTEHMTVMSFAVRQWGTFPEKAETITP